MHGPKHHRPLIGVTGPEHGAWPSWICTKFLIWLAGGKAVHLTVHHQVPVENLAGLILGGGADIDPSRYHEKLLPMIREHRQKHRITLKFFFHLFIWLLRKVFSLKYTAAREDKPRDEMELHLLKKALERHLPVLGICRGAQLINIYFGGSLYQDTGRFYVEEPELRTILPRVTVIVEAGSRLHRILKKRFTRVNSLHHQSVKDLGKDLKIVAREHSGVVEAIEHTKLPFVVGVQWHPEFLLLNPSQRQIFKSFMDAVGQPRSPVSSLL